MSPRSVVQAYATIFPAELPDKTMIATILLVARYRRPLPVWVGATGAFLVHVVVAVAAGSAVGLLPEKAVQIGVASLFAVGAVLLWRSARHPAVPRQTSEAEVSDTSVLAAAGGSFALILLAEWGDLTQLATASLAARSGDAIGTGLGAFAALGSVAAIAATFGRQLTARIAIEKINYLGAFVFAALAAWTFVELAT
ncbi:MAG: TMEM165/GDT1 family protein [Microthrixaceae bacterium]|nr:TMEM165/GDT1 family protein [Microthrixaceae bacterium]